MSALVYDDGEQVRATQRRLVDLSDDELDPLYPSHEAEIIRRHKDRYRTPLWLWQ